MQAIQITTVYAQHLHTTTYTPVMDRPIFYAYAAQKIFCQGDLFIEGTFTADVYDFAANTWSNLTQPADPGATNWSNNRFHPTLYQDKLYFQFISYKNVNAWGTSYLVYFDLVTEQLGIELFEYSFDPKFEEGYAKVFTLNGLAASDNTLLALWTTAIGDTDTFPIDATDSNYLKIYSFIIIKNLITGQWDQYQQLTEENWMWNEYYQCSGQIQRGTYIFLKTIGVSPDLAIGANYSNNGIFKNYYNPLIGTQIQGFCVPYNDVSCYVPIVYFKTNGAAVDCYVLEQNFFGVPPKPMYLTDITQWDLPTATQPGFKLYANYKGFEEPTSMEIDIDTAAGANVIQRTVVTTNTWVQVLASDGLGYAQYKWRCRFIDSCGNNGTWSDFTYFWVREKPTFNSVAFDSLVTQRPNLVIDLNDYGCPIDTIEITIDTGAFPLWRSGLLKAALYYNSVTDLYTVPIDTHGYIIASGAVLSVTTRITNLRGRTNHDHYNPTQVYATVASPTGVTITKYNGYMRLSWTAAAGATGYKIYKTVNGVRTYIQTTTGLYYDDLACEMNTPLTYGVASYDAVSQSADVSKTDSITTFKYALVCDDLWNIYSKVPVGAQLGETIDDNLESTGASFSSKFTTGTGSVSFDLSQYDYLAFKKHRIGHNFYFKVKNEVYHITISSFTKLRTHNTEDYTIQINFNQIFDEDTLNVWYLDSEWMET